LSLLNSHLNTDTKTHFREKKGRKKSQLLHQDRKTPFVSQVPVASSMVIRILRAMRRQGNDPALGPTQHGVREASSQNHRGWKGALGIS